MSTGPTAATFEQIELANRLADLEAELQQQVELAQLNDEEDAEAVFETVEELQDELEEVNDELIENDPDWEDEPESEEDVDPEAEPEEVNDSEEANETVDEAMAGEIDEDAPGNDQVQRRIEHGEDGSVDIITTAPGGAEYRLSELALDPATTPEQREQLEVLLNQLAMGLPGEFESRAEWRDNDEEIYYVISRYEWIEVGGTPELIVTDEFRSVARYEIYQGSDELIESDDEPIGVSETINEQPENDDIAPPSVVEDPRAAEQQAETLVSAPVIHEPTERNLDDQRTPRVVMKAEMAVGTIPGQAIDGPLAAVDSTSDTEAESQIVEQAVQATELDQHEAELVIGDETIGEGILFELVASDHVAQTAVEINPVPERSEINGSAKVLLVEPTQFLVVDHTLDKPNPSKTEPTVAELAPSPKQLVAEELIRQQDPMPEPHIIAPARETSQPDLLDRLPIRRPIAPVALANKPTDSRQEPPKQPTTGPNDHPSAPGGGEQRRVVMNERTDQRAADRVEVTRTVAETIQADRSVERSNQAVESAPSQVDTQAGARQSTDRVARESERVAQETKRVIQEPAVAQLMTELEAATGVPLREPILRSVEARGQGGSRVERGLGYQVTSTQGGAASAESARRSRTARYRRTPTAAARQAA